MFLEEMSCRRYDKKCKEEKEHHSYNIGTLSLHAINSATKGLSWFTEMLVLTSLLSYALNPFRVMKHAFAPILRGRSGS